MVRGGAFGIVATALMVALLVLLGVLYGRGITLPPNSLPWQPVVLSAPPGWIARLQMNRLAHDGPLCRAALATASGSHFTPLADRALAKGCGYDNVVRADESPIRFSPSVTATCGLTAGLYWYQERLAAAAQAQMHAKLLRITQLGTYSCRNVNGAASGSLSQHATANAIDVAAFEFADGRRVTVAKDYGKPTDAGRFLEAAHDAACGLFNTVLGPHYNRLHADHFHLDMGAALICS